MESLLTNPAGASNWVWAWGALSLILNLLYPLIALLLVLSYFRRSEAGKVSEAGVSFLRKNLRLNLIEEMRAWGNSMLWSFLFLIPGLLRFIRYLLLPFVVCFDQQYLRGEQDALKRTREISRGQLGRLTLVFLFFAVVVPLALSALDEWKLVWSTPLPALGICFLEMLFNLLFILCLWKIYQRSSGYDSTVSVERNSVATAGSDL